MPAAPHPPVQRVADEHPKDSGAFLDTAAKVHGSWWPDETEWLTARSGELKPAPKRRGGGGHRALGRAPGTDVYAR